MELDLLAVDLHEELLQTQSYGKLVAIATYAENQCGYYARPNGAPLYGFAHWGHPEICDVRVTPGLWMRPDITETALKQIARLRAEGYRRLIVVRSGRLDTPFSDMGKLPVHRSDTLLRRLQREYRLVATGEASGTEEDASVEVFRLAPSADLVRAERRRRHE